MHANHRFLLDFARSRGGRTLDYGCGAGETVQAARAHGLAFYGTDLFYGGNDRRDAAAAKGLLGDAVRELTDGRIPFDDAFFDTVVSNQVFEHIDDLRSVLAELARVLKPGGALLALFPTREVWRENHWGLPFAHWFPTPAYLTFLRRLGLGYHKEGKPPAQWGADVAAWLARYTHYRTRREVNRLLEEHFENVRYLESDYLAYRLGRVARLPLLRTLLQWGWWRWGGVVLAASRRA